jgi:hypothetical protein
MPDDPAKSEKAASANPISQVWDAVKARLEHQFFGPFLIAWAAWNWEFVAILLTSKRDIEERIELLKSHHCSWWISLIAPALTSLFYVAGSPWLSGIFRCNIEWADMMWGHALLWIEKRKQRVWIFRQPSSLRAYGQELTEQEERIRFRERVIDERAVELDSLSVALTERAERLNKLESELKNKDEFLQATVEREVRKRLVSSTGLFNAFVNEDPEVKRAVANHVEKEISRLRETLPPE